MSRWSTTSAPRLGTVERTDDFLSAGAVSRRLAGYDRVWVVDRWLEPGFGGFMFFTGIQGKFRLAERVQFSVPDWGVDVGLYVRKGSPADTSP
jgi:hypothetical protein